jgi:hypothetical protein
MASGWSRNTTRCTDDLSHKWFRKGHGFRVVNLSPKPSIEGRAHSPRLPGQIKKYQNLRRQGRAAVQDDIAECPSSRRQKSLMPLVQARNQRRHEECNRGPPQRPPRSPRQMQCGTPGAKQEKAQGKVSHKVATFPDVVMYHFEAGRIKSDEEMQKWIQNSASVLGRKPVSRFDSDEPHPQKRSNPGLE